MTYPESAIWSAGLYAALIFFVTGLVVGRLTSTSKKHD